MWSQDQIVKLVPSPRSGWSADDPGRLSAVHQARGVGCSSPFCCSGIQESPPAASVGRRSFMASFNCRLAHRLASPSGKYGNLLSPCWGKPSSSQKQSFIGAVFPSDFPPLLLTAFSFSFHNLCYLDEPTPLVVSMTESRTRCASRGIISSCCHRENRHRPWRIMSIISGTVVTLTRGRPCLAPKASSYWSRIFQS